MKFHAFLTLLAGTVAAYSITFPNLNVTFDPANDHGHGELVSPYRAVLKLDCPQCPDYVGPPDSVLAARDNATALMYDFIIMQKTGHQNITLGDSPFLPENRGFAGTPFHMYPVTPVPISTTIGTFLELTGNDATIFPTVELIGFCEPYDPVKILHYNVTLASLVTAGVGDRWNRQGNISVVDIFLLNSYPEPPTIEWWQIVPMITWTTRNVTQDGLPRGLLDKLAKRKHDVPTVRVDVPIVLIVFGLVDCGIAMVFMGLFWWRSSLRRRQEAVIVSVTLDEVYRDETASAAKEKDDSWYRA